MDISYFRLPQRFSFYFYRYDHGTSIGLWHSHDDNHFLLNLYKIN